jgi:hypothetical protein
MAACAGMTIKNHFPSLPFSPAAESGVGAVIGSDFPQEHIKLLKDKGIFFPHSDLWAIQWCPKCGFWLFFHFTIIPDRD